MKTPHTDKIHITILFILLFYIAILNNRISNINEQAEDAMRLSIKSARMTLFISDNLGLMPERVRR